MYGKLNSAALDVKAMIERNTAALDALIDLLMRQNQLSGEEVRAVVDELACPEDLEFRSRELEGAEHTFL